MKKKQKKYPVPQEVVVPRPSTKRWVHVICALIIVAAVFVAYGNTLGNSLIWDDEFLVRDNTYIRSFSHILDIFKSYLAVSSGNINNFYRPLQDLSYMVDHFLWGDDPFGYHLTNVILHAGCAALVYVLTFFIIKHWIAALVAGLLFGVHPINTEAIAYVAGRADPLYLLFFLLSFILFIINAERIGARGRLILPYAASVFCYACALLSKEIAVVFPAFLLLYVALFYKNKERRQALFRSTAPFFVVMCLYIVLRKTALDFSRAAPSFAMAEYNIISRTLTFFKAFCVYLKLLVLPLGLHMERTIGIVRSLFEGSTFLAVCVVSVFVAGAVYAYRFSKTAFFTLSFFVIGLFPVSNMLIPINSFIAEHWLYMPAVGIFMLTGMCATAIVAHEKAGGSFLAIARVIITITLIAVLIMLIYLTNVRNRDWKDEISFFKNTIYYSPTNARLHLNFGNTYSELGQDDKAIEQYRRAIELDSRYPESFANIGAIMLGRNQYEEAEQYIDKALSIKEMFPNALYMRGILHEKKGDFARAEEAYLKALSLTPNFIGCHLALAHAYYAHGQIDKAQEHWREVLRIAPDNKTARGFLERYSR